MDLLDPIVIREKIAAQRTRGDRERKTEAALKALDWFGEFAMEGRKGGRDTELRADTLTDRPTGLVVAGSTTNVEAALPFIIAAFSEMRVAIVKRAVEMAQQQLEANEVREAVGK